MSMDSLKVDESRVRRGHPGAFKVQGLLYRRIGPMLANDQRTSRNIQTYFFDPEEQARMRATAFEEDSNNNQEKDIHIFHLLH